MSTATVAPAKLRRTLTGVVVESKANKTVRVRVERRVRHRLYGKIMRRRNHILAHDANNEYAIGDLVMISECRRISKNKAWEVTGKLEKTQ